MTVKAAAIPKKSIYRLSLYQRCLDMLKANEIETVSSEALAKAAGVKSTQLRKDLAYFGQIGTRGLGYNVSALSEMIQEVLGTNSLQPVILVGVGNLGSALLRYNGFRKEGFEITAAFDSSLVKVRVVEGVRVKVYPAAEMEDYVRRHGVKMAIMAVPGEAAQPVANQLVASGVVGILNFSPTVLQVPENVIVNSVDLALELEHLSYYVR
jgi:redox-sensing transcriptional repressor